jgi:hypothetical protein
MRPSRLIVGEVRQAECLDLLIALNSGLPGMCTLHANSAREALVKMCTLPLLAGENVSAALMAPHVLRSLRATSRWASGGLRSSTTDLAHDAKSTGGVPPAGARSLSPNTRMTFVSYRAAVLSAASVGS